jgi:probable O-glycosylation ligase (exosortase A-associated)
MQTTILSKQLIFLVCTMGYFSIRSIIDPFWGIFMYYGFAVLRPQALWDWVLPDGIRWSYIAAIVAIVAAFIKFPSLKRVSYSQFLPILLLFSLCLFMSYIFAIDQTRALTVGMDYAKILLMLIVASYVVREKWHVRYLGWMIFVCLTYLVYEVNMKYLFESRRMDIYTHGYGGYDNNGAALMLAMVVPFCFYYFFAERRWWRWGFLICIIPTFHAIMLTYSRGAMLSTILVMVGMLLPTFRKKFWHGLIFMAILGGIIMSLAGPQVRTRFMSITTTERDASSRSRLDSWKAGLKIARDYPLFGAGIRNANLLTKKYGADLEGRTIHNVYIQIAADIGLPAAILYTSLLLLSLYRLKGAANLMRDYIEDTESRWFHYTCKASMWSLTTFMFSALFLSLETFELCYLMMLIGAVAPYLARQGLEELDEDDAKQKLSQPVKISTIGLSA